YRHESIHTAKDSDGGDLQPKLAGMYHFDEVFHCIRTGRDQNIRHIPLCSSIQSCHISGSFRLYPQLNLLFGGQADVPAKELVPFRSVLPRDNPAIPLTSFFSQPTGVVLWVRSGGSI